MRVINADITEIPVDVVVNAANGIGYMGGWIGKVIRLRGVAESIHYVTRGAVEAEARRICKKVKWLPRYLCGHRAGEIYTTKASNLPAKWIIHAVTMPYPGMISTKATVRNLLPVIFGEAVRLKAKSLALPLLGTGTGGLSKEVVLEIYKQFFSDQKEIQVTVVLKY